MTKPLIADKLEDILLTFAARHDEAAFEDARTAILHWHQRAVEEAEIKARKGELIYLYNRLKRYTPNVVLKEMKDRLARLQAKEGK